MGWDEHRLGARLKLRDLQSYCAHEVARTISGRN
jgi:hypothetical protein